MKANTLKYNITKCQGSNIYFIKNILEFVHYAAIRIFVNNIMKLLPKSNASDWVPNRINLITNVNVYVIHSSLSIYFVFNSTNHLITFSIPLCTVEYPIAKVYCKTNNHPYCKSKPCQFP